MRYWLALKDGDQDKSDAKKTIESYSDDEQIPRRCAGKNALVEKKQGELCQRHLGEVDNLVDIKQTTKLGDLIVVESPYIPTEPILWQDASVDDGRNSADENRGEGRPIVACEVDSTKDFVGKALDQEDSSNNGKCIVQDDELF